LVIRHETVGKERGATWKMTVNKLVSIVIPAYNAQDFIKDAVSSCREQTYRPIEVLVVNDGSTDSTRNLVNDMSNAVSEDELELKLIDVGENKGAANALNLGFSKADGDYVCWLSADDIIVDTEKTRRQTKCMERTHAQWSYFRDYYTGSNRPSARFEKAGYAALFTTRYTSPICILNSLFVQNSDLRLMALMFQNPVNGSSVMIRKDCFESCGQYDPITRVCEDTDLWLRYTALELKLEVLEGAAVFYRQHAAQTSKKKSLMLHGCDLIRTRMLLALEKKGTLTELIKKFTPYFPLVFRAGQHYQRPLVSEFLFNFCSKHKREFNPIPLKYICSSLATVRKHPNYLSVDRDRFFKDLELFTESKVFRKFEEIFLAH
jgi:teichuronic acid biosynthesis glycosyltransferase TuaG